MKKILIFGYTLEMGGAEKALVDTLNFLKNKYEIDLYLLEKKGVLLEKIPKNINVYQMKNNIVSYIFFRFVPFFRKKKINKIANKKDYDCAIGYMEGRCGTWIADVNKNLKKIAWIHNDVSKFDIGIKEEEIIDTYNKIDKIICVSKDAKKNFCNKYKIPESKVEVIYNLIDEKDISKKANAKQIKNDVFTFVNVAKMRDQKRQDRLVNSAVYLKEKGYKFKIQLIGDGPNLNKISDLVKNNNVEDCVEILGLKENPYPYVKAADFFVLCSEMEGYSIVTKEALFLKKKIVTTDVVGPREILEQGKYGLIIPNKDSELTKILEDILKNPKKYDYLDKNIKNYKGDNENIKKQLLELINE